MTPGGGLFAGAVYDFGAGGGGGVGHGDSCEDGGVVDADDGEDGGGGGDGGGVRGAVAPGTEACFRKLSILSL